MDSWSDRGGGRDWIPSSEGEASGDQNSPGLREEVVGVWTPGSEGGGAGGLDSWFEGGGDEGQNSWV